MGRTIKNEQTDVNQLKETLSKKKPKMSLIEKQAVKLKIQKERQAQKKNKLTPSNESRYYCTSAELHDELVKWKNSAKNIKDRVISDKFGKMLIMIADKMLNRSEFRNYPKELKEDAKGFFFVKAIKGLKNYNFDFSNAFAYFSTCAWNAYVTVITRHYKQQNIRRDIMKQMLSELETYSGIDPQSSLNNYLKQYIELNDNNE